MLTRLTRTLTLAFAVTFAAHTAAIAQSPPAELRVSVRLHQFHAARRTAPLGPCMRSPR